MCLSQFYLLSPRGDSIIFKEYRNELHKGTAEIFFRNVKFWKGKQQEAPPIFNKDGVNYIWLKKNGLYFVFNTVKNISPCFVMELLIRITKVLKDYCGILTEESIRTNFILIYELLDEILDYGYIQGTSTEILKPTSSTHPLLSKNLKVLSRFRTLIRRQHLQHL